MRISFARTGLLTATAAVALGVGLAAPAAGGVTPASAGSSVVNAPVFTLPLHTVGQVNIGALAKSEHRTPVAARRQGAPISRAAAQSASYRAVDNALLSRRPSGAPASLPNPPTTPLTTKNVRGEHGLQRPG